jgi:hypothetical protein
MVEANTTPGASGQPAGEQITVVVEFKQGQRPNKPNVDLMFQIPAVELGKQIAERVQRKARATVVGVVTRVRPGRPPIYRLDDINAVIEEAIQECIDDRFEYFVDRVEGKLVLAGIECPKRTRLRELCLPIYNRGRARR